MEKDISTSYPQGVIAVRKTTYSEKWKFARMSEEIQETEIDLRDMLIKSAKHQAEADRAARKSRALKHKIERLYKKIESEAEVNPFD